MNTRQIYFLTGGLALFAVGVIAVGFDYGRLRSDLSASRIGEGAIADDRGEGRRPKPYTEEELKSDMLRAEEYLRQNSKDSAAKAMELYNSILSYDTDPRVNQVARFGLASALYRMGDDRRSLEHLRQLKREPISDRALSENVDYMLGRILLLLGHEDEGRSLLQALLSRTVDRVIQSRVHTAFGDYYAKKGDREKAKRSYRIALEYYPDNFHAAFSGESARRFAEMSGIDPDIYDIHLSDRIFDDEKQTNDRQKTKKTKTDRPVHPKRSSKADPVDLQRAEELYAKGLGMSRKNAHLDALKLYLEAVSIAQDLHQRALSDAGLRRRLQQLLERAYYRIGESYGAVEDRHLAHAYFDRVLENPDITLDQAALVRKGILLFDARDYEAAYSSFNKAVQEFPDGNYTRRAEEWLRETENFLKSQTP